MLNLVKSNLVSPIQVAGEVNAALKEHTVVVVTKTNIAANYEQNVYNIYAGEGIVEDNNLKLRDK